MNTSFTPLRFLIAATLLLLAAQRPSLAGSATWDQNPSSGDWNTAANWTPPTVPNSTTDIATFDASNVTDVLVDFGSNINVDSVVFNNGAPAYTITLDVSNLKPNGAGFVNNSGLMQSVVIPEEGDLAGAMFFYNSASAGNMTAYSTVGGLIVFYNSSSAGAATFSLTSGSLQGDIDFNDDSTAGNATINASSSSVIEFFDSSSGGNSTLNLSTAAFVTFAGSNNAEQMTCTCIGGAGEFSSQMDFEGFSSAGEGTFTTVGGSTSGEHGSFILFDNTATADNATFVINGGMGAGLSATALLFIDTTTAANANITANGGVGGSKGGMVSFQNQSTGGTASITLNGNAKLDISTHNAPGVTIGSLAGAGSVLLGANTLTIGSNNLSTTFSGVIQDSGGLTKTGSGTLTLTGSNTYTGNTTVTAGVLGISNTLGSGAGTGSVNVQAGTLAGKGIISGAVTIGTGSGSGAFLAPAAGSNVQATLTIQSALTFKADATYTYTFRAKRNRARTDKVIANGVTINSGATIALSGQTQGTLSQGLVLTLISNTSANPISGTFSNLPDGGIVTINGNNFQASYEGGDGNDLTLTVVP
jgi:autotransporter-associated beta strand protein